MPRHTARHHKARGHKRAGRQAKTGGKKHMRAKKPVSPMLSFTAEPAVLEVTEIVVDAPETFVEPD